MIKSTSILLRNFFFKKNSIWSLFPALTPYNSVILSKIDYRAQITSISKIVANRIFSPLKLLFKTKVRLV